MNKERFIAGTAVGAALVALGACTTYALNVANSDFAPGLQSLLVVSGGFTIGATVTFLLVKWFESEVT
jgi:hypothetical protein